MHLFCSALRLLSLRFCPTFGDPSLADNLCALSEREGSAGNYSGILGRRPIQERRFGDAGLTWLDVLWTCTEGYSEISLCEAVAVCDDGASLLGTANDEMWSICVAGENTVGDTPPAFGFGPESKFDFNHRSFSHPFVAGTMLYRVILRWLRIKDKAIHLLLNFFCRRQSDMAGW